MNHERRRCYSHPTRSPSYRPQRAEAFVIVLVPPRPDGEEPDDEAHYPYSDPFYACVNRDACDCLQVYGTHRGSVSCILPGRRFEGRLTGNHDGHIVRAHRVVRPVTCYAVITPDGLWHQCFEPEPQDIAFVTGRSGPDCAPSQVGLRPDTRFSKQQVAWRYEVARLLEMHADHWAIGCTAFLEFGEPQKLCPDMWE